MVTKAPLPTNKAIMRPSVGDVFPNFETSKNVARAQAAAPTAMSGPIHARAAAALGSLADAFSVNAMICL
jgi:hypothetical protein